MKINDKKKKDSAAVISLLFTTSLATVPLCFVWVSSS